jgi:hypothetical protein
MLARYQMILRQGKPRIDPGILRLDYRFNNMYMLGSGEKDLYENQLMRANQGIYTRVIPSITLPPGYWRTRTSAMPQGNWPRMAPDTGLC